MAGWLLVVGVAGAAAEEARFEALELALAKSPPNFINVDGPFEYRDGTGLVGYVVSRNEDGSVDFRPCSGAIIPVEEIKLKRVDVGCGGEPPIDGTVVLNDGSCIEDVYIKNALELESSLPLGIVYRLDHDGVKVVNAVSDEVHLAINSSKATRELCGNRLLIWDGEFIGKIESVPGAVVLGVVSENPND